MLHLPPVRDHHTHAGLSASLRGCLDLSELDRKEALARLKALPEDRLNTVHGWHSGKVPLAPADLENLPPILLINMSLHGFLLTPRAVARLEPVEPEILANRHDPLWCERNTPRLLGFYGRTACLEPDKFEAFMEGLEAQGIDRVEKVNSHTIDIFSDLPNPVLVNQLTELRILSKAWAEKNKSVDPKDIKNKDETFAHRNAMGTGPYTLESWQPDVRMVFKRNPNWWGKMDGNVTEIV
ncbi:MAG TPA: ABC transporter substrate-binding protein, partial [Holophaga sp.]|nr:ABC transporter substrate-binding protein [Holophaga sp.]